MTTQDVPNGLHAPNVILVSQDGMDGGHGGTSLGWISEARNVFVAGLLRFCLVLD